MDRKIPLPRGWNRRTEAAILQILALSHYAFTAMLARASKSRSRATRLRVEIDRLDHGGVSESSSILAIGPCMGSRPVTPDSVNLIGS